MVRTLQQNMLEYKQQLKKGSIQAAYKGLMEYMSALRTTIERAHPEYSVPRSLYFGYMDMTYFSIVPASLKEDKLKIAVVFLHREFRFEVWLSAVNKQVQTEFWNRIKAAGWDKYRLVPSTAGYDSIIEDILVEEPDFDRVEDLGRKIDAGVVSFVRDVEIFLGK